MSVIAESPDDQSTAITVRKPRTRRQPQPIQSPASKASQFEAAAYGRLLERAEMKEALFRLESAQVKRDSVSRKLCAGSAAVSVEDLARWETELAAAKDSWVALAKHSPLHTKQPLLAAH
ncbi:MAG: hypothetical protein M0037_15390 [Betaproteobacteria bacterium]|nr:hypothetical protein [Betaproteobacteria bacterium]